MIKGKWKQLTGCVMVLAILFTVCFYAFAQEGIKEKAAYVSSALQDRIDAASDNDTIYLEAGIYEINNPLVITDKRLTFIGDENQETVLKMSAGNNGRHINTNADILLENIVLDGSDTGGGIYGTGSVTMANCTVKNCLSNSNGGGVYTSSIVTLTNSQFLNNEVTNSSSGGAVYTGGGGTVTGALFQQNKASASGGAIVTNNILKIDSTTFEGNEAAVSSVGDAGAVLGTVQVRQSSFIGNIKHPSSGYNMSKLSYAGAVSGSNCTFANTVFRGNTAYGRGGAVAASGDTEITNCIFDSNNTKWNSNNEQTQCIIDAGALYSSGSGVLTIKGTTFSNNSSFDEGGAIMADMENGTIEVENSTFADNIAQGMPQYYTAVYGGGAMYILKASTIHINHSTITGNKAYRFGELHDSEYGGGVYLQNTSSKLTVTSSIISGNSSGSQGSRNYTNIGLYSQSISTAIDAYSLVNGETQNIFFNGTAVLGDHKNANAEANTYAGNPNDNSCQSIQTIKIQAGGLADNIIPMSDAKEYDQRGAARGQYGFKDAGAYEVSSHITAVNTTQRATVGSVFENTLDISVKDDTGAPVSGAAFTAEVLSASEAAVILSNGPYITDANGKISITATANGTAGSYSVSLTPENTTAFGAEQQMFTLTNAAINIQQSGTPQSTRVNTPFEEALELLVTDDLGNPIEGVEFALDASPSAGAAALLAGGPYRTGSDGKISITASANDTAGTYTVFLRPVDAKYGTEAFEFTLTNIGVGISIAGTPQSALVHTAFENTLDITVADDHGKPIEGVEFEVLSIPAEGASAVLSEGPYITNSDGILSITATANETAGSYAVIFKPADAKYGGEELVFNLTNTSVNISITGGDSQTALVGKAFENSLEITVTDDRGNPMEGIAFEIVSAPTNGASARLPEGPYVTNSSGKVSIAATANDTAGTYTISFKAADSIYGTEEYKFTLTNEEIPVSSETEGSKAPGESSEDTDSETTSQESIPSNDSVLSENKDLQLELSGQVDKESSDTSIASGQSTANNPKTSELSLICIAAVLILSCLIIGIVRLKKKEK